MTSRRALRVVAIVAAYNEERFIRNCLTQLISHGVGVYLIDNDSTDNTRAIAEEFVEEGVIGVEHMPRSDLYSWRRILDRKAALCSDIDADWFMHVDADEIRLAPRGAGRLRDAIAEVDAAGYTAVNFLEYTFVPTREAPDHDHVHYLQTMLSYYPFVPRFPDRLNTWKNLGVPIDLSSSGGHCVEFDGLRMYPESFPMRHYLYLSLDHAVRKYVRRAYDPEEVRGGWHRARARLREEDIALPSASELSAYIDDAHLDPSSPRRVHLLFDPNR